MKHNQAPTAATQHEHHPEAAWPQTEYVVPEPIADAVERVFAHDDSIAPSVASTIAAELAAATGAGMHSGLSTYSRAGHPAAEDVVTDCIDVYTQPGVARVLQRWACWLALHVGGEATAESRLGRTLSNGDALDAFLRLEDTNIASETLLEDFANVYGGSYADMDEVINETTEVAEWQAAVDKVADYYGISDFIKLDRDEIEWFVRDGWTIVDDGRQLHVFDN